MYIYPTNPRGQKRFRGSFRSDNPLSLPSPRASGPTHLDRSRANIAFTKTNKTLSESPKRAMLTRLSCFFLLLSYSRWVFCKAGRKR